MHKNDYTGATEDGEFTNGDPAQGIARSLLGAKWLNSVQRELVAPIEQAGITLSDADDKQLVAAVTLHVDSIDALRALPVPEVAEENTVIVYVEGTSASSDGGAGFFRWQHDSEDADDGVNVIEPDSGPDAGRWVRVQTPGYFGPTPAEENAGVTPVDYGRKPGDVHRFAAVGDGTNDDGPAIAAAISAANSGDPVVTMEAGKHYAVATWTPLQPSGPVHIVGYGATVEKTDSPVVFLRPEGEVHIEGIQFKGFSSVVAKNVATENGNIEHLLVRSIKTDGLTSNGILVTVPISKYRIEGNDFENHTTGYPVVIGRNEYAEQDNWEKGWVVNNSIKNISASGDLNGILLYGRDKLILGNYLEDLETTSSAELAGIYTKARFNTIAFNVVRGLTSGSSTSQGINVKGSSKLHTDTPQGYATRVIGNHVEGVTGTGGSTGGYNIRLQIDESLAIGNTVLDSGKGSAYIVDADFEGSNVIVANNIGRAATSDTAGVGVRATAFTHRLAIRGNIYEGFHAGIRLASLDDSVQSWAVTDNIIKPGATTSAGGVVLRRDIGISRVEISRNMVEGGDIGIRFETGVAEAKDVRVLDNNLEGCVTPFSGILPRDLQLRHCAKAQTSGNTATTAMALTLPDESAYMIELRAVGMQDDGSNRAMFHREALVYRTGGADAAIQGTVQDIGTPQESDSDWDATITVSGSQVRVTLQGDSGQTVEWKYTINILGVG